MIWGKTRPELSKKYREIVCTGGVFADTAELVRIYPVPLRYMDDEHYLKKYQWIEADVTRSASDARPESYKIRYENIRVGEFIPSKSGNWDRRAEWLINDRTVKPSVEALKAQQQTDGTSLGLVKPAQVHSVYHQRYDVGERKYYWDNYRAAIQQMALGLEVEQERTIKPLTPPDFKFKLRFSCNDPDCEGPHTFGILDWEVDALYGRLRKKGDDRELAADKVVKRLKTQLCDPGKDLYLFLGNIASHPTVFTCVGLWYPKVKRSQLATQGRLL